ncbi:carboxypeptidase-like regulatory domain-containing protein [Gillisia sp. Q332]|uniref:carboxypeptidase-like regulatory domain-containing protein n=1 Tax=Gillisia xinjiangensis TaxID=3384765 RepID=UPI00391C6A4D
MKIKKSLFFTYPIMFLLTFLLSGSIFAVEPVEIIQQTTEYKGVVVDSRSGDEIASAYLTVVGTNISTITNADGEFSIKIPVTLSEATITTSHLGYQSKTLPLSFFKAENTRVELDEIAERLSEISIYDGGDAQSLVKKMFEKKESNYVDEPILMTAFYRETIKKGRRNVSLSEAVVKIYKAPYDSFSNDEISLFKARKTADYEKLDTLALKLRGGPYNTLYVDIIKYPQYLMEPDMLQNFKFDFDAPVRLDNQNLYVVNFESHTKSIPWYYGKLFIDTETLSLVKATYNLNVDNRKMASQMFVRKKPRGSTVYPIDVSYQVDYRQNDGKWQYGYGTANLVFVVNWKNKLFNSRYTVNGEMAVTDWETLPDFKIKKDDSFIKPSVVMSDDVSGFTDVNFWGNNNIIEPEKSIQNAIEKIQRQLQE